MRMEKSIEKAFAIGMIVWSNSVGISLDVVKFSVPGRKGYPDRLIMWGPPFQTMFIEFKQPGAKPRALQEFIHVQMRAMGAEVQVHDNVDVALEEAKRYILSKIGTGQGHEVDSSKQRCSTLFTPGEGENCYCIKIVRSSEEVRDGRCATCSRPFARSDYFLASPTWEVGRFQGVDLRHDPRG